jgi:hypothetical protein
MAKSIKGSTIVEFYDDEDRALSIKVDYVYHKETSAYFDKSFGNYLPGDPAEMDITVQGYEAEPGMDPAWVQAILNDEAAIGDKIIEEGSAEEQDSYDDIPPGTPERWERD